MVRNIVKNIILTAVVILAACCARACAYELYWGDLHSHTSFSDGQGLADEAFDFARNEGKTDFWTVSDHLEQLQGRQDLPPGAPPEDEFGFIVKTAGEKTADGEFVAIPGFEWATDYSQGHINAINAKKIPSFAEAYQIKRFYKWVYKHPEVMIGFNHPWESNGKHFNDFEFVPPIYEQVIFCAVTQREDIPFFYKALDRGWWVAPSAHQDNHEKNWGLHKSGNFTAVYADKLTYDSLMEALRARRFFATNDRPSKIWFAGNGQPMGSKLTGDSVELEIEVSHAEGAKISAVTLVGGGGAEIRKWNPGEAEFKTKVTEKADRDKPLWFAVLAEFDNGRYAISAPISIKKL